MWGARCEVRGVRCERCEMGVRCGKCEVSWREV